MKRLRGFALCLALFLAACGERPASVTIVDGEHIRAWQTTERLPAALLLQAGITLNPGDRLLLNGFTFPVDQSLPQMDFVQLQIRRAVTLTLSAPQGQGSFQTSALTVGQALSEAGIRLTVNDFLDPPAATPITQNLTVTYSPARELTVLIGGQTLKIYSSKPTVGEALAEAGIPLAGMDQSYPEEKSALPADGAIRAARVVETVEVALEAVPFTTEEIADANLPMGQDEIVQPGINGLALVRTRIRYADGAEISRVTEEKTVVREPQKRIVKSGSQIVMADINGLDYWLATQMYATVYSPCASGISGCSYSTASGARAGYGIVAVDTSAYKYLAGMRVYVPGYGTGTVGDTGGGSIIEAQLGIPRTKWIDLGFDDGKIINLTGWVTVYFLAPAPAEIPHFLK